MRHSLSTSSASPRWPSGFFDVKKLDSWRKTTLLRTRLGRLIRDIRRKIAGQADLETVLERPLARAEQIRSQQQRPARVEALFLPRARG
jgi:hypothetical protein